ncbi:energy-coupling factor ABC transporter ATP-binding protein [Timonella sp. A28]|uniref:energy-coupling factor ABC transporter ATP-binding protein n=1 Tax=Timonella sp. A28 TaxID=3442640 RepID=UPI003EBF1048
MSVVFDRVVVEAQGSRLLGPVSVSLTQRRIAVLGENGSGKSTFLKAAAGLIGPQYGSVRVAGHDTIDDETDVRRVVGFCFAEADAQLLAGTVGEDIELSVRVAKGRNYPQTTAEKVLQDFGLSLSTQRACHTLSGGQKQALALASVLTAQPTIIVCDEPTTRLDLRWRRDMIDVLCALQQQLIIATHDLDFAVLCDRVLVIDDGLIVFDGNPEAGVAMYEQLCDSRPSRIPRGCAAQQVRDEA